METIYEPLHLDKLFGTVKGQGRSYKFLLNPCFV
jgi:hypothetical protein